MSEDAETPRIAGKIEAVMLGPDSAERESLLRTIATLCGEEERQRIEFWAIAERKDQCRR